MTDAAKQDETTTPPADGKEPVVSPASMNPHIVPASMNPHDAPKQSEAEKTDEE